MSFNNCLDKNLAEFRKHSGRSVIVCETDMDENSMRFVYHYSENLRKLHNKLIYYVNVRLNSYFESAEYAKLSKMYSELDENESKEKHSLGVKFSTLQESFGLTTQNIIEQSILLRKESANILSDNMVAVRKDILRALRDVLYNVNNTTTKNDNKFRQLRYIKDSEIQSIRSKQFDKNIVVSELDGKISFSFANHRFGVKNPSDYISKELDGVVNFLKNSSNIEKCAVSTFLENGEIVNTHRPCYCTLICKTIRGKKHVYIHITIEGSPFDISKHTLGKGRVGIDVGTQNVAISSDNFVGMCNLTGRGLSPQRFDDKIAKIMRKMDNSIRATNPQCFNEDGTYKKGTRIVVRSKRYKKLHARLLNEYRKFTINRKLYTNELVNKIIELGDEFVIEPKNAAELALRKEFKEGEEKDANGKFKSKHGHGWAVGHFGGGYFQSQLEKTVAKYGGKYTEVNKFHYKASQYNHFTEEYNKKSLEVRMCNIGEDEFGNDVIVQRDMYSAFILSNSLTKTKISQELCERKFWKWYELHNQFIIFIKFDDIIINCSGLDSSVVDI